MPRRQHFRGRALQCTMVLVPLVIVVMFILQKYSSSLNDFDMSGWSAKQTTKQTAKPTKAGPCTMQRHCAEDHFSFFIQSGAANVVPPKICVQNKLALGMVLNNAGNGLNIVVISGTTGEVTKTGYFNMYGGEVEPLIEFLKAIEQGSAVLIASYDEASSKLNDEAKKLITELGSAHIQSLGFRDNWVFVGGKGATVKSNFEKHIKNDNLKNKYESWPEMLELNGCIPNYLQ